MSAGKQSGFSYIGLLIAVAIMSALLAQVATFWQQAVHREKERELLVIGDEFRTAITRYYEDGGAKKTYPMQFEDLLQDNRVPFVRRYLRKLYHDPLTGNTEWGIIKGPGGSIAGVYSISDLKPLKVANFGKGDEGFVEKKHYSDWQFAYVASEPLAVSAPVSADTSDAPSTQDTAVSTDPAAAPAAAAPAVNTDNGQPSRSVPATASPDARKAYICRVFHQC